MFKLNVEDTLYAMCYDYEEDRVQNDDIPEGYSWELYKIAVRGGVIKPPYYVSDNSTTISSVYCEGAWWELTNKFEEPRSITVSLSQIVIPASGIRGERIVSCNIFLLKHGATEQEGFEKLGSPKQDDLWDLLQKHNLDLFRAGKRDFFSEPALLSFSFKTGRPKK